jgi:hypothetical protein
MLGSNVDLVGDVKDNRTDDIGFMVRGARISPMT